MIVFIFKVIYTTEWHHGMAYALLPGKYVLIPVHWSGFLSISGKLNQVCFEGREIKKSPLTIF